MTGALAPAAGVLSLDGTEVFRTADELIAILVAGLLTSFRAPASSTADATADATADGTAVATAAEEDFLLTGVLLAFLVTALVLAELGGTV